MSYTLLRWFRQGVSAALDADEMDAPAGARAKLTVSVTVGGTAGLANQTAAAKVDVLGPGDVVGLDARQVIRTFPVAGTLDFEADYFAHLELDRPDLPWLFSPLPPVKTLDPATPPLGWSALAYRKHQTVTPWLCLAVVPRRDGVTLEPGLPLPLLKITSRGTELAGGELPLLDEAHAWAHVQITGDIADPTPSGIATMATAHPEQILSRLICPRRLQPNTAYIACLVPTFKSGREAGLGQEITVKFPDELAWAASDPTVELPVYFHWEFSTGGTGDFESLVRRLESRNSLPGVGTRSLDITTPGFGLTDHTIKKTVQLGGALRVTAAAEAPIDTEFSDDLLPILNAVDAVAPPIYGRWHAAVTEVTASPKRKQWWINALNLDPRYRVAAGLGTRVVQDRQEDLMAAVWEQFGEIVRANQLLRQAQLAVASTERIVARHLAPLADLELLAVAGPALGRIRVGKKRTARRAVAESCLPLIALSGAFRRIVRARGPIQRRFARGTPLPDNRVLAGPKIDLAALLTVLATGQLRPKATIPDGAIPVPFEIPLERRTGPPKRRQPSSPIVPPDVRTALATLAGRVPVPKCLALETARLVEAIRHAIEPDVAIGYRVRAQIELPEGLSISRRLDPIMAAPLIPTPMIGPLQELGQEWLLPGLAEIPPNTITIVQPDAAAIEAYMVGLNHEMARELLWRGFPTDQRGTVFSQFWDRRGAVSTGNSPVPKWDLKPIHTWDGKRALGDNLASEGQDLLLLLVRGDLLQRYPRATIYLQRASWKEGIERVMFREPGRLTSPATWDADARFPSFSGRAGADITFLGFPLSPAEARGDEDSSGSAGWFVVFQEQPTEPRFGLSTAGPASIKSWDDLSWPRVVTTAPSTQSGHLKIVDTSTTHRLAELPLTPRWDGRSDSVGAILLKHAFRLFVHARDLVAE